ncbi:MAG: 50S ribosomal protein L28, partial [Actinomycetia bacterium]|nr:50S ribosomal protein L28 [Actinomycetes bacterium]
ICGKKPVAGNTISHSHKVNKRRFMPNLQKIRAEINGKQKNIKACTRCLKAGKVNKVF